MYCLLDNAIHDCWDSQSSNPIAIRFRNFHPSYWDWAVLSIENGLFDLRPPLLHDLLDLFSSNTVYSRSALVAFDRLKSLLYVTLVHNALYRDDIDIVAAR